MATVAFRTAIREALDEELAADERVILFGEDVAVARGVFATTTGLYDKYGPERVFDSPISELALAGAAFGRRYMASGRSSRSCSATSSPSRWTAS
jgi:pyruvate/2-oxoglutarate/acetoin dehydrogenase E1 component